MKRLFFILLACFAGALSGPSFGQSFKDQCDKELGAPKISVQKEAVPTPRTIRVPSLAYATHYVHLDGDITKKATLGYTEVVRFVDHEFTMDYLRDKRTGRVCARGGIQLNIGYRSVVINIVDELPDNSCAYTSVWNHEAGHVQIYSQYLDELSLRAIALFEKEQSGVEWGDSVEDVAAKLAFQMESAYLPKLQEEFAKVQVRHTSYDNPAEQLRILKSCNGDIVAILSAALKTPL